MSNSKLIMNKNTDDITTLLDKTKVLDCLMDYFYITGFDKLNNINKLRILISVTPDKEYDIINLSNNEIVTYNELKSKIKENIIYEMNNSENTRSIEENTKEFIKYLESGKIEIRAYTKRFIHPKLYILTLNDDTTNIITGSTNITSTNNDLSIDMLLSSHEDYTNSKKLFDTLWQESVDVTEIYTNTIKNDTWINDSITPYELYLKFLYEYFYEQINNDKKEINTGAYPKNYKMLEYQRHAVTQARDIINTYNGVFISDVVGLGKTYMGALLLKQLNKKALVIAPPTLIDENNPGSWENVLKEFEIDAIVESRGKVNQILDEYDKDDYQIVLIDESHYFRNENTQRYESLYNICRGKKVILISATPYNNNANDLRAQIKLFQYTHQSNIGNIGDIDRYFDDINKDLNQYDKKEEKEKYKEKNKEINKKIREDILKYIMVRRTRDDIDRYYNDDLKKHGLAFPTVHEPIIKYYKFNEKLNKQYNDTLKIITKELSYAKYAPLSSKYMIEPEKKYEFSQRTMSGFIKTLLIKRLESSIHSFKKSIKNSIKSHKEVIKTFEEKKVFYTSLNYNKKIYQVVENEDLEEIDKYIEKGKIKRYPAEDFTKDFIKDLKNDLKQLEKIDDIWSDIKNYPKEEVLTNLLNNELKKKKVIIFTEFIDTAELLYKEIQEKSTNKVFLYTGHSRKKDHQKVIDNFDANKTKDKQDNSYDILITTDVLSHGVNLHRSNIIINYDIPWNPTKIMQRIGRVQRLGTEYDEIFIYNFFPADEIEDTIQLKTSAQNKIDAFIQLLGTDSQYLTDETIESHDLFKKITGDILKEETIDDELKYLSTIRKIRDEESKLYDKITQIPLKAKITRKSKENKTITLIKTNDIKKILKTEKDVTTEIDFYEAIDELKATTDEEAITLDNNYYRQLHKNYNKFNEILNEKSKIKLTKNEKDIIQYIFYAMQDKNLKTDDKIYLKNLEYLIKQGTLTKKQCKKIKDKLKSQDEQTSSSIIKTLNKNIDKDLLDIKPYIKERVRDKSIILSEYFREE